MRWTPLARRQGKVYRATDTKLGRNVALKVSVEMASSPERPPGLPTDPNIGLMDFMGFA